MLGGLQEAVAEESSGWWPGWWVLLLERGPEQQAQLRVARGLLAARGTQDPSGPVEAEKPQRTADVLVAAVATSLCSSKFPSTGTQATAGLVARPELAAGWVPDPG